MVTSGIPGAGASHSRASQHTRRLQRLIFLAVFASIVLLLAGGGIATISALRAEQAAREQVARTQTVISSLLAALRAGLNAETGERGFLLTGIEEYLGPYQEGSAAIDEALDTLDAALSGAVTRSQTEKISRLREAYANLFDVFARAIALHRADRPDEVRSIVAGGDAKRTMDVIRELTDSLVAEEQSILLSELERAERFEKRSLYALSAMGATVLALLVFVGWLAAHAIQLEAAERESAVAQAARDMAELRSRELNHRVKNLFSLVLAIISLTSRDAKTPEEATERARERIAALSRAHEASQGRNETGEIELNTLISLVLAPYEGEEKSKIRQEGPLVRLTSEAITPLGLILHEWATNAAKYGALSLPAGRVELIWRVVEEVAGEMLVLEWKEIGGPKVEGKPEGSGFGSRMTDMASRQQLGGQLEVNWPPEGMHAVLTIPLAHRIEAAL